MDNTTERFDGLLAELRDLLGPVLAQRERLSEICKEVVAILEPPRQPKEALDRVGDVAEKLDPPWVLTQDQRIKGARAINPTQATWGQLNKAIEALGPLTTALAPIESVLAELRRVRKSLKRSATPQGTAASSKA